MSVAGARTFILGAYHDLPNVLFIGTLLFGTVFGYLPLVWVALGLVFTAVFVQGAQQILGFLKNYVFASFPAISVPTSRACSVFYHTMMNRPGEQIVAPSQWISSVIFFATFLLINSILIIVKEATPGANPEKVDARRAYGITVAIVSAAFLLLVAGRYFTGCETWFGALLGIGFGVGSAAAWWKILDACGTGMVPDILQVFGSMAPPGDNKEVPVMCVVPKE